MGHNDLILACLYLGHMCKYVNYDRMCAWEGSLQNMPMMQDDDTLWTIHDNLGSLEVMPNKQK